MPAHFRRVDTVALLVKGLGSPHNTARLACEIDVSASTAQRRISDLCESCIVWPVRREHDLRPQLRAQEKAYFTDPIYTQLTSNPTRGETSSVEEPA
ncbi:MAG: hypothetical protein OXI96_04855 [Acidimicrobiaceae bacterium]|nr:hypothetical protein [Acidimicrobiaceae bacterium]